MPAYGRVHFGLRRPRFPVLGCDFAGQVEAAGSAATRFAVGDEVFGTIAPRFGAHTEYVCVSENGALALKPSGVTYGEAATLVDATALCFLRDKAQLRSGQTILINGASGAVGSAAVQLAKHLGAIVTGVCSGPHAEFVRKLGADDVIDYAETDFTRTGRTYDVIFDVVGKSSFARSRRALTGTGIYLTTAPSPGVFVAMPLTSRFSAKKALVALTGLRSADAKQNDLRYIAELVATSQLTAVIDACYPLDRIADAHWHIDAGHKIGNIVAMPNR
jgi:NADPH:quinone reductase-like Zn-dependent oxidoreductase